jgi:tetratricopeptide (TPR) repeat protein
VQYFDKALAVDPKNVKALTNKGVALYYLGNYTLAIQYYDKALAVDPKYVAALNNKGNALAKLVESANTKPVEYHDWQSYHYVYVSFYDNVVSSLPLTSQSLNYGKYAGAVQSYDDALSIDPNNIDILGNKGLALIKLGYYPDAVIIFDKILSIDSNSVIGLYNKSTCFYKLGHHIQAKELHDKALKLDRNYTPDYQNTVGEDNQNPAAATTFAPAI